MTHHSSLFSKLDPASHPLNIHIADGSTMHGNSLDFVSTSNLSIPGIFHVPDLSYNLCSVGQLAELGYRLIFYYSGCIVQDPRTGQELGTFLLNYVNKFLFVAILKIIITKKKKKTFLVA